MGGSTWSSDAYDNLKSSYSNKTTSQIFTSTKLANDMSPKNVKFRESRDSDAHPETLAIAVFLDETGSMGEIPSYLIREKLDKLIETLIKHGIPHPQVLFGGIGDHHSDSAPLQVGQFESGTVELNKWLTTLYLEGNGGGQNKESYLLAYLFAARHTSTDTFEKRGVRNLLFTIGDEGCWESLDAETLKNLMGYTEDVNVTVEELLNEVHRTYHVFHIHVNNHDQNVIKQWRNLLGERLIILDDYTATAEVIASTVALVHGVDLQSITSTFDAKTKLLVDKALANVSKSDIIKSDKGVINL
jgi:hypothetical protein